MATFVQSLPPEERVEYYRAMAAEAFRHSQSSEAEDQKLASLDAAARWNALASEVEAQTERLADTP